MRGRFCELDAGEDMEARTDQVLSELDLRGQADTLVGDLSGGERRRAACGMELVGRPRVLLLDEPTSGLDPVLERRLMLMFRRLADGGRAVVVATHATASLDLCDTVAVMSHGQPSIAADADDAVAALQRSAAGNGAAAGTTDDPEVVDVPPRLGVGARPFGLEFRALTSRYALTLTRDRHTASCYICLVKATLRDQAVEGLVRELYGLGEVRRELGRHALAGLGTPGFVALAAVCAHGPLRVSDVAQRLAVDVSVVSRQVGALCAAGYAVREPDPSDRRAQQIVVTEAGRAVLDASHRRMVQVFAQALRGWSAQEVDGLSLALARLREAFAEMDSGSATARGRRAA